VVDSSGDVFNISALVNGAMSSKNFFVEGRNKRSALRRPSSARFEAAYGEKRFFGMPATNVRPRGCEAKQDVPLGARRRALRVLGPTG